MATDDEAAFWRARALRAEDDCAWLKGIILVCFGPYLDRMRQQIEDLKQEVETLKQRAPVDPLPDEPT